MPWAWVENNRIRDIAPGDPSQFYHPDIAAFYNVEVPEGVERGAELIDGEWVNPAPPAPVEPPPPSRRQQVSPVEFKLLFTSQERLAIKAARSYTGDDPQAAMVAAVVDDFYDIVEDPRLTVVDLSLPQTQEGINFLATAGLITSERAAEIISGIA